MANRLNIEESVLGEPSPCLIGLIPSIIRILSLDSTIILSLSSQAISEYRGRKTLKKNASEHCNEQSNKSLKGPSFPLSQDESTDETTRCLLECKSHIRVSKAAQNKKIPLLQEILY